MPVGGLVRWILVLGVGCVTHAQPVDAPGGDADRSALLAAETAWGGAIRDRDVDRVLSFFADDGVSMPPGEPAVQGQQARRAWLEGLVAEPDFDSSWETTRVEVARSGDLAVTLGTTRHGAGTTADGRPLAQRGKFVTVWRRVDGEWRVVADIWNEDGPPAP